MSKNSITHSPGGDDDLLDALQKLQPSRSRVSKNQLIYRAGQRAGRTECRQRRHWIWPATTAMSWLFTATVAGMWLTAPDEPQANSAGPVLVEETSVPTEARIDRSAMEPIEMPGEDRGSSVAAHDPSVSSERSLADHMRGPAISENADVRDLFLGNISTGAITRWRGAHFRSSEPGRSDQASATGTRHEVPPSLATYAELKQRYLAEELAFDRAGDSL